jgi:hypothetical protein
MRTYRLMSRRSRSKSKGWYKVLRFYGGSNWNFPPLAMISLSKSLWRCHSTSSRSSLPRTRSRSRYPINVVYIIICTRVEHTARFTGSVSAVTANSQHGYSGALCRPLPWLRFPASGGVSRDPRPSHVGGGGRPWTSCESRHLSYDTD